MACLSLNLYNTPGPALCVNVLFYGEYIPNFIKKTGPEVHAKTQKYTIHVYSPVKASGISITFCIYTSQNCSLSISKVAVV